MMHQLMTVEMLLSKCCGVHALHLAPNFSVGYRLGLRVRECKSLQEFHEFQKEDKLPLSAKVSVSWGLDLTESQAKQATSTSYLQIILKDGSKIREVTQLLPSESADALDWLSKDNNAGTLKLKHIQVILP